MKTLRTKIALGFATLAIAAASLAPITEIAGRIALPDLEPVARKINEYEGQHLAKKGSFDITSLDSQPTALAGDPSQWG